MCGKKRPTASFLEGRTKSTQGLAHSRHSICVGEEMCSVCRTQDPMEWSFFSWETRWTVMRSGRCPTRPGLTHSLGRYHSMTRQLLRKADGVVLMYDVTSQESFVHVRYWLDCLQVSRWLLELAPVFEVQRELVSCPLPLFSQDYK